MVISYFKKTISYGSARFILESAFIAVLFKLILGVLLGGLFFIISGDLNTEEMPVPSYRELSDFIVLFFFLCFIAPTIETFFIQWLPIKILSKVIYSVKYVVVVDALIFSLMHLNYGIFHVIGVFPAGIMLAWSFILNSKGSLLRAFLITSSIHALYNFTAFMTIYLF